jgi:hypothetical protein
MHLMSIIMKLQPAANKGSLQSINAANISPDDPECQTSKAYQKGYIVPNNTVTSDHPIGDNRWWEDFHQRYVAATTQRADQERMAKEEELAQRQQKAKEKEEAKQATAAMQAVAEELVRKKKAEAEEERKKAKETKKKKAAPTQAKKQVEKQVEKRAREVDTEESEEVEEDAGEDRGRRASRAISISAGPSRARTPSRASKRVKRTPSEDDGRPRSDEDEAEPNLLDAFYDPVSSFLSSLRTRLIIYCSLATTVLPRISDAAHDYITARSGRVACFAGVGSKGAPHSRLSPPSKRLQIKFCMPQIPGKTW